MKSPKVLWLMRCQFFQSCVLCFAQERERAHLYCVQVNAQAKEYYNMYI